MTTRPEGDTRSEIVEAWRSFEGGEGRIEAPRPTTLMLEVTNACNLSCTMCMNPKMQRKLGRMSLELLERILGQAKGFGIERIALYTTGEPFMHPKIFDIIERVKSHGFYAYITTNLQLLDASRIERLLTSGIDSLKYSIDGINQQEYESIRLKGSYDKLMENIGLIKQRRDALGVNVKLMIGIILANYNYKEKGKYIERYGPYVDEIIFSLISNQAGHIDPTELAKLKPRDLVAMTDWKPCRQMWDRLVVTYDGKLVACCIDFEAQLEYGDLTRQTLDQAWNSPAMQRLRRAHLRRDLAAYPLCQGCDSPFIQQTEVFEQLNE